MCEGDEGIPGDARLYYQGRLAFEAGDYRGAIDLCQRSNRIHEHYESWECIGSLLLELRRAEQALAALQRAFELNPRSCKSGHLLVLCMHSLGLPRVEICEVIERVLTANPTYGPTVRFWASLNDSNE